MNGPKEEESAPTLPIHDIGPCEALPNDWKVLFFMFQDDDNSVKEDLSTIKDNSNNLCAKGIDEDASFSHATNKGFFFMFEQSSPCCVPSLQMDVCDEVHSPSFDEELVSPMEN